MRPDGTYICVSAEASYGVIPGTVLTVSSQVSKDATQRTLMRVDAPYYKANEGGEPISGTYTVHIVVTTPATAANAAEESGLALKSCIGTLVSSLLEDTHVIPDIPISDGVVDLAMHGRYPFADDSVHGVEPPE